MGPIKTITYKLKETNKMTTNTPKEPNEAPIEPNEKPIKRRAKRDLLKRHPSVKTPREAARDAKKTPKTRGKAKKGPPKGPPKIRNTLDLVYKLLRETPWTTITSEEASKVVKYVIKESPEAVLTQHKVLRTKIVTVFGTNLEYFPKKTHEAIRDHLLLCSVIDARTDFYSYAKLIAKYVIPNDFKDGRHLQVICENLQSLYESYLDETTRTERLQVFLPPRSMKSVLCSIIFPSWILGRTPKYRILLIGGNVSVAIDVFGRPLKNLIASQEFQAIFPGVKIDPDVKSAQRFNTREGGGFYCAGAGQGIAGRGGDFVILDDVINEQNAWSKVERTKINNNYVPGIRSRSQPGAGELIVNTRWHLDDISGFTQKMDGYIKPDGLPSKPRAYRPWKIVSVPAILNSDAVSLLRRSSDPKGLFKVGGSYWPEYKPLEELQALKQNYMSTEPYKWEALYMQNPVPDEGNIVKFKDFKVWNRAKPPKVTQIIASIDTAYSDKQRADYTAISIWGVFYSTIETINGQQSVPQLILLYCERGKWNFHDLCEKLEWIRSESPWKPDNFIVEKAAGSVVLIRELYRRQFSIFEYDPRGKKSERLQAASILIKAGRIWVPKDEPDNPNNTDLKLWAQDMVEEICNFPSAPHDDYMDTATMAIIWLRDNGVIHYEAYDYQDDDEDEGDSYKNSSEPKTYWGSLTRIL